MIAWTHGDAILGRPDWTPDPDPLLLPGSQVRPVDPPAVRRFLTGAPDAPADEDGAA